MTGAKLSDSSGITNGGKRGQLSPGAAGEVTQNNLSKIFMTITTTEVTLIKFAE